MVEVDKIGSSKIICDTLYILAGKATLHCILKFPPQFTFAILFPDMETSAILQLIAIRLEALSCCRFKIFTVIDPYKNHIFIGRPM
jgi:hypothetical protein